jgi:murein DD-endopeptidase MepM/ murein hydrolase activator NlpD
VLREDDSGRGYRGFVTGLHVYVTSDHGGLPAGSEILVGYAEAAARWTLPPAPPAQPEEPQDEGATDEQPAEPAPPGDDDAPDQEPSPGQDQPPNAPTEPQAPPPGAPAEPPAVVLDPPPGVRPQLTGQGYVFPVYGLTSFGDDFAAPRATTGWHHGNDLFADLGAPVLAVANGTLFSVGWNTVGGHRLWLRDDNGNEYYYAHLSAYSPLAVDGARVAAGDVVGFVGNTGDAQGTPYHLHFEIHPAALLGLGYDGVVDPYSYLLAWKRLENVSFELESGPALPGAVLLEADDISAASGLEPGALERAMELPALLAEGPYELLEPSRPSLVGGGPGFASLG